MTSATHFLGVQQNASKSIERKIKEKYFKLLTLSGGYKAVHFAILLAFQYVGNFENIGRNIFSFFWPRPQHMDVPWPGTEPEP